MLSCFGKSLSSGRDNYYAYVKDGLDQGRRPELVGGGLIRSLGGWAEASMVRLKGQNRMKGDERILGDGDFVMNILSDADERLDRGYELKSLGYDLSGTKGFGDLSDREGGFVLKGQAEDQG